MNTGKRLQELAKELNITQTELANSIGITSQYISKLAMGKNQLSMKIAAKVELKYGISVNWLLYGEGEKYIENALIKLGGKDELICRILFMTDEEVQATLAYVMTMESIKNS